MVTREKIEAAEPIINAHMGGPHFNRAGWEHILNEHGGKLPISIKAVPEGSIVPTRCCLLTVVNTDPKCFWLTNYLETLLVQVWYPMSVATNSRAQKKVILDYYEKTGCDDFSDLGFKLLDFGFRGVSSPESAAIGGLAHLVNFCGSDTMAAMLCARKYYLEEGGAFNSVIPGVPLPVPSLSVPAAEHSTITSWGKDGEKDAFANMLDSCAAQRAIRARNVRARTSGAHFR